MGLVPQASVQLGNLRYDAHAIDVSVSLALLPGVNAARVALPRAVRFEAEPGDGAKLTLDGGDAGGDGVQTALTGHVVAVRRSLHGITALCADAGAKLAALRPAVTFRNQDARAVIRGLADEAGADLGTLDLDLSLAAYVTGQARSAAEHVAALARLSGAIAAVDGDGRVQVLPRPGAQAQVALRHGREFVAYDVRRAATRAVTVPAGNGPAGSTDAPDALQPGDAALPDAAPSPGANAVWRAAHVLRTPSAASAALSAAAKDAAADATRLTARCWLLPHLRPGQVVEVQDLPDGVDAGPWLLTRVAHRLHPRRGATTTFEAVSAGASASLLDSLLGAALGAVGGLL